MSSSESEYSDESNVSEEEFISAKSTSSFANSNESGESKFKLFLVFHLELTFYFF